MALRIERTRESVVLRFVGDINHSTTTRILPPSTTLRGRRVTLDLAQASWVEPFGLVFLYSFVHYVVGCSPRCVHLQVGTGAVGTYLRRMHFVNRVAEDFGVEVARRFPWLERDLRGRLIELKVRNLDDEDEVDDLAEELIDLIFERSELSTGTDEVRIALQEAISNAVVHSGRQDIIVAAQSYIPNRLLIAIGDLGMGIPERLRRSQIIEPALDDHHAIDKALKAGVSTRVGRGGLGLPTIVDLVEQEGRRLTIRSGRGQITVSPSRADRTGRCDPVAGTILEIAL